MTLTQRDIGPPQPDVMVCPTMIGREREVESFSRLIEQLLAGRGTTVLITGEAGIGKSRLVAETRARTSSRGVRVFEGAAFELGGAAPYGPITDLFRTFLQGKSPQEALDELCPGPAVTAAIARLVPAVAPWLPSDGRSLDTGTLEPQHLLQALLLAFDQLLASRPSLVIVEDVHWADEASLDLLLHLARSAPKRSLLLVLTMRGEDAGPSVIDFRATLERQRLITEFGTCTTGP